MFSNVRGFSFAFHAASEGVGGRDSMRSQRAAPKSRAADVAKHDRATNPPCYPATIIALPTLRRVGHLHAANGAETSSLALRLTSSPRQGFVSGITPAHACRATCRTDNPQGELLSVPKISQAYPGTQEEARTRLPLLPCLYSRSCSDKITIPDPICSPPFAPPFAPSGRRQSQEPRTLENMTVLQILRPRYPAPCSRGSSNMPVYPGARWHFSFP